MRKSHPHLRLVAAAGAATALGSALSGELRASTLADPLYVPYGSSIIEYGTLGTAVGTQTTDVATPEGVAVDSSGNVYWSEFGAGNIWEASAGTFPSSSPTLFHAQSNPIAMTFDTQGDLYVAGYTADKVYEFNSSGSPVNTFTTGSQAWGVAIDSTGNLFVSNGGSTVYKFAGSGGVATQTTNPTSYTVGSTDEGIATDSSGNVFVLSRNTTNTVYELNASQSYAITTFNTLAGSTGAYEGLAFDGSGDLYASGLFSSSNYIYEIGSGGVSIAPSAAINVGGAANSRFFAFDNAVPEPATIGVLSFVGVGSLLKRPRKRRRR